MDTIAPGMISPPGYANPTTPGSATVKCGCILQDENFESTSTVPLEIGFALPTSWSDDTSFSSDDGGFTWNCLKSGIYNLKFNQQLTVVNAPAAPLMTPFLAAVGDPIVPTSLFYLNLAASGAAPQSAPMDLIPATPGSSKVINATGTGPVLMGTFTTPADFLTSTDIPAGTWTFSQWASTEDESENTNLYFDVYSVDADGSGNPTLIKSGSANPTLIPNISDLVTFSLAVPNTVLVDLTKRIQVRAYVVFGTAEAAYLYYGGSTVSNVLTFINQVIPPPTEPINFTGPWSVGSTYNQNDIASDSVGSYYWISATPGNSALTPSDVPADWGVVALNGTPGTPGTTFVQDTVNLEITIASPNTTEFSQVFRTSIPIVLVPEADYTYSASVDCIANVDVGSTMVCTIASQYGVSEIVSGYAALPSPQGSLQWNLIAQGEYGNVGVIV